MVACCMIVIMVEVEVEEVITVHGVPCVSGTKRGAGLTWLARQRWQ